VTGERDQWLARDGVWRPLATDPPAFAGEIVETTCGSERPLPGDADYLWQLTVWYAAGRLTVAQGEELLHEHDQAVDDREAKIVADCQALVDAGEARWIGNEKGHL
jgi:hypothetical protein